MDTAQRKRLSPRPRRRAPAAPAIPPYQRNRAGAGLAIFVLIFGFLWIVNGSFTAGMVASAGGDLLWGWALHISMSAIEVTPIMLAPYFRGAPRKLIIVFWLLSLPFGIFDVFSSAAGMASWMQWTQLAGLPAAVQNTVLGEALAFLPEPMLVWLLVLLHRVLRS